jgi:hypothetical protein
VYKLSDESETPIKVLTGLAGRQIFVHDPDNEENKTLLVDCDDLPLEKISFLKKKQRPNNSSLEVWRKTAAALVEDNTGLGDKEKTQVEVEQREIRKQRAENDEVFVPQYFEYNDEKEAFTPIDKAFERFK